MMRIRMRSIFWKRKTEIFFNLALKIRKLVYENGYKAFDIYVWIK